MKKLLLTILLTSLTVALAARPATRKPLPYTQPDGSVVMILLQGDEFHHWMTDMQGNLLKVNTQGFLVPAAREELRPSASQVALKQAASRHRLAAPAAAGTGSFPVTSGNFGAKKGLVIMISFSNLDWKYSKEDIARMLNEEGYSVNGADGSVRDFYMANSDGRFYPEFDVYGPYEASKKYNAFSDGVTGTDEVFFKACIAADNDIDFSRYDSDGDGYVDLIAFFFAGYNQAESGTSGLIWPYQFSMQDVGSTYATRRFDGVKLSKFFCTSEFVGSSGKTLCSIGTTCHEFAHSLGLPDMYDSDYSQNGNCHGMLTFSPMNSGADLNEGRTPAYFPVYERVMLGWADESKAILPFTYNGKMSFPAVHTNQCYRSETSMNGEFFLYEFRDGTGWDRYLPAGLAVYHIDMSSRTISLVDSEGNRYSSSAHDLWHEWEYMNSINANGSHPCGYVISAASQSSLNYGNGQSIIYGYDTEERMVFPGKGGVSRYTAKDWNNQSSDISLSEITLSGKNLTAVIAGASGGEDPTPELPDLGYAYIVPASVYEAGAEFPLQVRLPAGKKAESITWSLNGKKLSGSKFYLPRGENTLSAQVTYAEGVYDVIEMVFTAE
ncbi:MAG: M6 family metalloprotease domain-containing protein [Bacteroidales bacterium]|nr:M6 family metalloprotease domain-containing protein [Bacteroidales bacterium]